MKSDGTMKRTLELRAQLKPGVPLPNSHLLEIGSWWSVCSLLPGSPDPAWLLPPCPCPSPLTSGSGLGMGNRRIELLGSTCALQHLRENMEQPGMAVPQGIWLAAAVGGGCLSSTPGPGLSRSRHRGLIRDDSALRRGFLLEHPCQSGSCWRRNPRAEGLCAYVVGGLARV